MEIKDLKKKILTFLKDVYSSIPENTVINKINNLLLNLALARLGYGNAGGHVRSGEAKFIREWVAKIEPEVCIDVGANRGDYTSLLLQHTNAHIYCIEPLSPMVEVLKQRFSANSNRVSIINKCLADFNGKTIISFDPNETMMTSLAEEVKHTTPVVAQEVTVSTLDSLLEEFHGKRVDFIKIDTEGFEKEVLLGAKQFIKCHRPKYIQIEFGAIQLLRKHSILDLASIIQGYKLYQITPFGLRKCDMTSFLSNIFVYSNFVLLRGDV